MERHVIGLALEVLFILALMLMFRRCERQRVLLSPPPGASPVKNGVGPPKDQRHSDGTARGRRTGNHNNRACSSTLSEAVFRGT